MDDGDVPSTQDDILIIVGTAAMVGHETRATAQQLRQRFYVQAWQIRQLMPEQRRR